MGLGTADMRRLSTNLAIGKRQTANDLLTSNTEAELTVVGIDIGKEVFHLVGFDANGEIAVRRKIRRVAPRRDAPSADL